MKKLIGVITLAIGMLIGSVGSEAQPPSKIVGLVSECDTTIITCNPTPLAASLLCDGTGVILDCPQFASPDLADTTGTRFFGVSNRSNPPRCVRSIVGGTTWGLCDAGTVSPFTSAVDLIGSGFAVANNGALIAVADHGANNCEIRRSTDYGVSWSTVFTDTTAAITCSLFGGSPTSNIVKCAKSSGYCVVFGRDTGTANLIAYYSSDNGASWTKGTPFALVGGGGIDSQIGIAVADDGNSGSVTRYQFGVASIIFGETSGSDWTATSAITAPPGATGSIRCTMGAMIFSGQSVICGPDTTNTTQYHFFTHSGGSGANAANVIPQNGLTNAQTPDYMAVGFGGSTAYIVGRNAANTQIILWITQDTFGSMAQFGALTPTTALIAGGPRGDIFTWRGKIYFTSGASGANAFFGVVQ